MLVLLSLVASYTPAQPQTHMSLPLWQCQLFLETLTAYSRLPNR